MSACLQWRKKHHVCWHSGLLCFVCLFCGRMWAAPPATLAPLLKARLQERRA